MENESAFLLNPLDDMVSVPDDAPDLDDEGWLVLPTRSLAHKLNGLAATQKSFFLVLMTPAQREMFRQVARIRVNIDETQNVSRKEVKLASSSYFQSSLSSSLIRTGRSTSVVRRRKEKWSPWLTA